MKVILENFLSAARDTLKCSPNELQRRVRKEMDDTIPLRSLKSWSQTDLILYLLEYHYPWDT